MRTDKLILATMFFTVAGQFRYFNYLQFLEPIFYFLSIIIVILKKNLRKEFSKNILLFIPFAVWVLLTTFWSAQTFVTLGRTIYFFLIVGSSTAFAVLLINQKVKFFDVLYFTNLMVLSISVFSLVMNIPNDAWTGGNAKGFMGFAEHQNTLGVIIFLTMPSVIMRFYNNLFSGKSEIINTNSRIYSEMANPIEFNGQLSVDEDSKISKSISQVIPRNSKFLSSVRRISKIVFAVKNHISFRHTILDVITIIFNMILMLMTYSRASILAFFLFLFIVGLITNVKLTLLFTSTVVVGFVIVFLYSPDIKKRSEALFLKGSENIMETRLALWKASYEASLEGSLFGIGYGISHPDIRSGGVGDHYEQGRFVREKGNSILALIEEVGIVGLILFFVPIYVVLKKCIKSLRKTKSADNLFIDKNLNSSNYIINKPINQYSHFTFHFSLSIAFIVAALFHAQFEAWIVGVGSFQLFIFISLLINSDRLCTMPVWKNFRDNEN